MLSQNEKSALRELAARYIQIASAPENEERRRLWVAHNDLKGERPLILIDQVCWSEMDFDKSLVNRVLDPYWQRVESFLREAIYQAEHMPVDRVYPPYLLLPRPVVSSGWGIETEMDTLRVEEASEVASQRYVNQIKDIDDLARLHDPQLRVDEEAERNILRQAEELFGNAIPYRLTGFCPHLGLWDTISTWMGAENCYIALMEQPELLHALMERLTVGTLHMIDQMEDIGLFDQNSHLCHCSHTYSKFLPAPGSDPAHPRAADSWAFGLAQLFTAVAPSVTREFELPYMKRIFPRFGAIYYGCCERLDDRLELLGELPKVKKISCSPWSDKRRFAERLPAGVIMSNKPSPALLASDSFNEEAVRRDLRETMDAARACGRPLELILKDISTVRHDPVRLWRWAEIAMEEALR